MTKGEGGKEEMFHGTNEADYDTGELYKGREECVGGGSLCWDGGNYYWYQVRSLFFVGLRMVVVMVDKD